MFNNRPPFDMSNPTPHHFLPDPNPFPPHNPTLFERDTVFIHHDDPNPQPPVRPTLQSRKHPKRPTPHHPQRPLPSPPSTDPYPRPTQQPNPHSLYPTSPLRPHHQPPVPPPPPPQSNPLTVSPHPQPTNHLPPTSQHHSAKTQPPNPPPSLSQTHHSAPPLRPSPPSHPTSHPFPQSQHHPTQSHPTQQHPPQPPTFQFDTRRPSLAPQQHLVLAAFPDSYLSHPTPPSQDPHRPQLHSTQDPAAAAAAAAAAVSLQPHHHQPSHPHSLPSQPHPQTHPSAPPAIQNPHATQTSHLPSQRDPTQFASATMVSPPINYDVKDDAFEKKIVAAAVVAAATAQPPNPPGLPQNNPGARMQRAGGTPVTSHVPFVHNTVEKRVACESCGLLFGDVGSLKRHAARAHRAATGKGPVYCQQCNAGLKNEQNLRRHVAVCHSGEQGHRCDMCSASFSSRGSLRIHQQQVHAMMVGKGGGRGAKGAGRGRGGRLLGGVSKSAKNDRSYVCDMCTDTFKWKGNLKRHRELRHLQLRPFICQYCNATFGTKSNMRVHLITHSNGATQK